MNIRETLNRIAPESEAVDLSDLSAYAHGYLDAESKYMRMIADGELVEVVRCKDCKEYYLPFNHMQVEQLWTCMRYGLLRNADDFCSRGERRTNEQT